MDGGAMRWEAPKRRGRARAQGEVPELERRAKETLPRWKEREVRPELRRERERGRQNCKETTIWQIGTQTDKLHRFG
ncbi:hypothetical protein U1Q18_025319, partial [Sarracenia purpurea var. burkii]